MDTRELAALRALYAAARPTHIPGAWLRDAIARMMAEDMRSHTDERASCPAPFSDWPLDALLDHVCDLATLAREQLRDRGRITPEVGDRLTAVRGEILARARVARFLASEREEA